MYKAITNLEKLCRRLIGAARSHGQLVADSLVQGIQTLFAGDYPNVLELHGIVAEELETLRQEAVAAETSLMASLSADQKGRAIRNRFYAALREQLIALRKIVDGLHGAGAADIVFMMQGAFVYVDPAAMYRQAVVVHDNLIDPGLELPEPRFDVGADLKKSAREMAPNIAGLGQLLDDLELQGTVQSLAKKEARLAEAQERAGVSGRLLEALAAYARQPLIAKRIRLSSHTSSAAADEAETAVQAEPAPQGEGGSPTGDVPTDGAASEAAPSPTEVDG